MPVAHARCLLVSSQSTLRGLSRACVAATKPWFTDWHAASPHTHRYNVNFRGALGLNQGDAQSKDVFEGVSVLVLVVIPCFWIRTICVDSENETGGTVLLVQGWGIYSEAPFIDADPTMPRACRCGIACGSALGIVVRTDLSACIACHFIQGLSPTRKACMCH